MHRCALHESRDALNSSKYKQVAQLASSSCVKAICKPTQSYCHLPYYTVYCISNCAWCENTTKMRHPDLRWLLPITKALNSSSLQIFLPYLKGWAIKMNLTLADCVHKVIFDSRALRKEGHSKPVECREYSCCDVTFCSSSILVLLFSTHLQPQRDLCWYKHIKYIYSYRCSKLWCMFLKKERANFTNLTLNTKSGNFEITL